MNPRRNRGAAAPSLVLVMLLLHSLSKTNQRCIFTVVAKRQIAFKPATRRLPFHSSCARQLLVRNERENVFTSRKMGITRTFDVIPNRRAFWLWLRELRGGGAAAEEQTSSSSSPTTRSNKRTAQLPSPTTDVSDNRHIVDRLLGIYPVSVCSIRGYRSYMEDEFAVAHDFVSVFDGHGGAKVSQYLRQNLYAEVQAALPNVVAARAEQQQPQQQQPKDGVLEESNNIGNSSVEDITLADKKKNDAAEMKQRQAFEPQLQVGVGETQRLASSSSLPKQEGDNTSPLATTTSSSSSSSSSSSPKLLLPTVDDYEKALQQALEKVDREVQQIIHWSYQGSTAVAIWIHEDKEGSSSSSSSSNVDTRQGTAAVLSSFNENNNSDDNDRHFRSLRTLVTANIGDSRAVLSRNASAINLTRDHKPNDPIEQQRIEELGGSIYWHGHLDNDDRPIPGTGVYRVNGNLALSRAIGDRSERPVVTADPEISLVPLQSETDEFVVLATDGLWDVMSSSDVVKLVHKLLSQAKDANDRKVIVGMLVEEALRRGSYDNITVIIVWLNVQEEKQTGEAT